MEGHHADAAYNGESAIEKAKISNPDAVLLDIGLPPQQPRGWTRVVPFLNAHALLIALSGYGGRPAALARCPDHHLTKPVDPRMLSSLCRPIGETPAIAARLSGDQRATLQYGASILGTRSSSGQFCFCGSAARFGCVSMLFMLSRPPSVGSAGLAGAVFAAAADGRRIRWVAQALFHCSPYFRIAPCRPGHAFAVKFAAWYLSPASVMRAAARRRSAYRICAARWCHANRWRWGGCLCNSRIEPEVMPATTTTAALSHDCPYDN
jgi:CheY-like chemotaxis protein